MVARWKPTSTDTTKATPQATPSDPVDVERPIQDQLTTSGWKGWRENPGQKRAKDLLSSAARYICLVGGSRSGKTTLFIRAIVLRALAAPNSRHAVLRFKANAARTSIIHDTFPKVMREQFPQVVYTAHKQDNYFSFANGSEVWVGGLDEAERAEKIFGNEFVTIFFNECSQIPYSSVIYGLTRLAQVCKKPNGEDLRQRALFDLNPTGKSHWSNVLFGDKKNPHSRNPVIDPENYVREFINPVDNLDHLSPDYIKSLEGLPERQRRRFFEGIYLNELEEALWSSEIIDRARDEGTSLWERINSCIRVVVAVDPSGAAAADDITRDEIGIIVAGKGSDNHAYILADRSLRDSPQVWATAAVKAYHEFKADRIVAEANFGGEMVRQVIHAVDPNVPVHLVSASRGKVVRAEPIAALYEQGLVHHVDRFDTLEEQLYGFTTSGYRGEGSPDHADALVWALSDLMLEQIEGMGIFEFYRQEYGSKGTSEDDMLSAPPPLEDPDFGFYIGAPPKEVVNVVLRVPSGVSQVIGLSGRAYTPANNLVLVSDADAKPLLGHGYEKVL